MQIIQSQNGGIIIWNTEDFIGLVSGYGNGNYPKLGKGSSHQVSINPFREATIGILSPGFPTISLTDASTQVTAIIKNATVDRSQAQPSAWLIEATKIHQIVGSAGVIGTTISTTAPFPYSLSAEGSHAAGTPHTGFAGEDICFFKMSDGNNYVFWSYNDNTDGDVGRIDVSGSTFDDDWFSTQSGGAVLDKTVVHPLIIGDDQVLYIADGRTLRWITDAGVCSSNITIVPRDYIIKAFTKTGQQLVIYAERQKGSGAANIARGDAIALFWDYQSQTADYIYQLNDNEVTAGFNWNGIIGCFTTGRPNEFANIGYRSKLQIFEGGRFVTKHRFSESAPGFGGVEIHAGMLFWNSDGTIYALGSPYEDFPQLPNAIGKGSGTTSGGYCKSLNGTDLYISTGGGTSCEYLAQGSTYYSNSQWRGLTAEPIFPAYTQGKVSYIEIGFFGTASGGRTFTLQLDFDYGTSTKTILDAISVVTAGNQIVKNSKDSSGEPFPQVFSAIKPIISWATGAGSSSAPRVSYIKVFYENVTIK